MVRGYFFITFLLVVFLLCGCGYHFSGSSPITLPQNKTKLYFDRVDNPTQEPWLTPYMRSELREEFTRRGQVSWTEKKKAETMVRVNIKEFTASDSLKGEDDVSVKYQARITLRILMLDADKGNQLWDSGWISGSESFYTQGGKQAASRQAVDNALQKAADELGEGF